MKKSIVISSICLCVICVILILFFLLFPRKYDDLIKTYSNRYGLSEAMVASIINIESSYDSRSVSRVGAIGLMQLLPTTAYDCANRLGIEITQENLYEEDINVMLGCYYLSYLLQLFDGNVINALSAYNWGLGNVKEWIAYGNVDASGTIANIPVKETKNYIKKYNVNFFVYKHVYKCG